MYIFYWFKFQWSVFWNYVALWFCVIDEIYCQDKGWLNDKYLNRQNISTSSAVTSVSLTKKHGNNLSLPSKYVMKSGTMIFMWQYSTHEAWFLTCIAFILDKKADDVVSLPSPSGELFADNKFMLFEQKRRELLSNPNTWW